MAKKQPDPKVMAEAEALVRKITDRWREEGQQDTPEHVIVATAKKVAEAVTF